MPVSATLPAWFAHAVAALQAGDIDGWMTIYAPDAVHEFPFAPAGAPSRVEGREAITDYMRAVFANLRFGPLDDLRVHEADDMLVVEATGRHSSPPAGTRRDLGFVWIITRRDGQVVRFRDYMNPLQLAEIVG